MREIGALAQGWVKCKKVKASELRSLERATHVSERAARAILGVERERAVRAPEGWPAKYLLQ